MSEQEREAMLERVREALKNPALRPGAHGTNGSSKAQPQYPKSGAREWLPAVGPTFEDRIALFQRSSAVLKASFSLLSDEVQLGKALVELRDREGWKKIGVHSGPLTEIAVTAMQLPVCFTDSNYNTRELEQCDAGISACDALVAQTGSVLVTNHSAGGRALSILPPHHVVLARREQLVADLPEAFDLIRRKYGSNYPSMISFITGPSRTGDIERILVLGAHGPKKLTILCF